MRVFSEGEEKDSVDAQTTCGSREFSDRAMGSEGEAAQLLEGKGSECD